MLKDHLTPIKQKKTKLRNFLGFIHTKTTQPVGSIHNMKTSKKTKTRHTQEVNNLWHEKLTFFLWTNVCRMNKKNNSNKETQWSIKEPNLFERLKLYKKVQLRNFEIPSPLTNRTKKVANHLKCRQKKTENNF